MLNKTKKFKSLLSWEIKKDLKAETDTLFIARIFSQGAGLLEFD